MRRLLASCAAAGVGIVLVMPSAHAANPPAYNGSRITTAASTSAPKPVISAEIHRRWNPSLGDELNVSTKVTPPTGLAAGCATNTDPPTKGTPGSDDDIVLTTAPLEITCNGTYHFEVRVLYQPLIGGDHAEFPGDITVAAPPGNVAGTAATIGADRKVALTWTPLASTTPDFLGYRVERQTADGRFITVASLNPEKTAFQDDEPIPGNGELVYRVRARRDDGHAGEVLSETGEKITARVEGDTTSTTTPGDPGTTTGGTDAGATDGTTAGTTAGAGTGGTAGTAGTTGGGGGGNGVSRPSRGRTGIGVKVPGAVTNPHDFPTLAEEDEGFSEDLPFDQALPGDESDEDDLASLVYEDPAGRGMAVPVATGFVLAAWAFHLRFLARAARPTR